MKTSKRTLPFWVLPALLGFLCLMCSLSYDRNKFMFMSLCLGLAIPYIQGCQIGALNHACGWVAKYSYGIYLLHDPAIWLGFVKFGHIPIAARIIIFLLTTFGGSVLLYHALEHPMILVGNKAAYWSRPLFHESEVLGTVVTFIDISRRKRLQAQFLVAQKMETLGQMAGTIAHDFRNALSVIAGYSQLIEERLSADENGRRYARQISAAANRAATFTSQLLGLNRKQSPQPGLLDVNAMLLSMEDMLRRIVGANISLSIVLDPKSRRIWADPGHIEQLLMNLIVNARDAMPNGGELVIETSNGEPEAQPDVLPFKPAGYLLLSVSDNGCGMDHATQNRIFEPFFTTKEPGKGTGLGLSTVREIVKEYEGGIGVWSEPGIGTSFTVYLPFAADTCGPQLLSQAPGKINPSSETILVVENDEALRSLIADTLRANGYTVLESPDGNSSIALAGSYDEAIHLLLTDFVLPDITGEQAARQILASRSYTEVLFMSGYTEEYFTERGIACRGIRRLQKPFDLISMLQSVRKTLDQTCQKPRVAG